MRYAFLIAIAAWFAAAPAPPCTTDARYRAFDFWLGTWNVYNADGRLVGTNEITTAEEGCALIEQWRGAQGSTGMSINYFDPSSETWQQHWVAASSTVIELEGAMRDGSMVLEGTLVGGDGSTQPMRGIWTPLEDGRVRQYFEVADTTQSWTPWFEGFYERVDGN